jgi:hypothetical protein
VLVIRVMGLFFGRFDPTYLSSALYRFSLLIEIGQEIRARGFHIFNAGKDWDHRGYSPLQHRKDTLFSTGSGKFSLRHTENISVWYRI